MRFRSFDSRASYNSLQAALQRRFSKSFTFGLSYTLSRAKTDSAGTDRRDPPVRSRRPTTTRWPTSTAPTTSWPTTSGTCPKGSGLLGGGGCARALLDNWTLSGISWIASGNPIELTLTIAGVNAAQRLLGTDAGGNVGRPAAALPRRRRAHEPTTAPINPAAFSVPGIGDDGPYDRFYLRNPGFNNHDLSLFKNFPIGSSGKRMLQLRLEMFNVFNHTQFSGAT